MPNSSSIQQFLEILITMPWFRAIIKEKCQMKMDNRICKLKIHKVKCNSKLVTNYNLSHFIISRHLAPKKMVFKRLLTLTHNSKLPHLASSISQASRMLLRVQVADLHYLNNSSRTSSLKTNRVKRRRKTYKKTRNRISQVLESAVKAHQGSLRVQGKIQRSQLIEEGEMSIKTRRNKKRLEQLN